MCIFKSKEEEAKALGDYMKLQAARDFDQQSSHYATHLNKSAQAYRRFMPTEMKDMVKRIEDNPYKDPAEISPEIDPFSIDAYRI
uniref:Uncharacterized protein n=1 Tax=Romanomermis culicivorax TaxID=13658 RepID=A0A915JED7_ROMCU